MPLDVPTGSLCFIDTNILVYHFVENPRFSQDCRRFLGRVVAGEITAVSAAAVVADVVHKVMAEEARLRHAIDSGVVTFLQRHPAEITQLTAFVEAARQLERLPIRLLAVDLTIIREAAELAQQHGLLTNDATIVALMQRHGITHLATNDDDFDRVPGITVWKPRMQPTGDVAGRTRRASSSKGNDRTSWPEHNSARRHRIAQSDASPAQEANCLRQSAKFHDVVSYRGNSAILG